MEINKYTSRTHEVHALRTEKCAQTNDYAWLSSPLLVWQHQKYFTYSLSANKIQVLYLSVK
jgi:hypothetical protein